MFRPADLSDLDLLLRWRNEDEQKGIDGGWYKGQLTTRAEHQQWFIPNQERIAIWVEQEAVGMVRIESDGSIAFHAPEGVAVRMLRATHPLCGRYGGRLKAVVDEADTERQVALERAGFTEFPAKFYAYKP